jgi:hypothetical protein
MRYKYASRLADVLLPLLPSPVSQVKNNDCFILRHNTHFNSHADATHNGKYRNSGINPQVTVSLDLIVSQTISNKQSLECVQTLLKAGLGCISYLRCVYYSLLILISPVNFRGLLPAENFGECQYSLQTAVDGH